MDRSATDDSHEMVQITGVHRMGSHILVADGGVHRMGSRIFVADGGVHESGLLYFYAARTVHNPGYIPGVGGSNNSGWSSVNITDNKSELFLCSYAAMSVLTGCVE